VLVEGPGYIGGDGRSIMPAYPDMTLAQLTNLVAYLKTLGGPEMAPAGQPPREQAAAGYRVRLVYKTTGSASPHEPAGHAGAMPPAQSEARLQVFLPDSASNESIPYMPVSARIAVPGKPAQTVKLSPSLGQEGFHYGASVTLPAGTS